MKDIKEYITENRTEDAARKAFSAFQSEDDFSGAGEIFGEMFSGHIGDELSLFIYGVAEAVRKSGGMEKYKELDRIRQMVEKL